MNRTETKNQNEKIRKLAEFKTQLERKIKKAEDNLEKLRILLELVNETLLEKGFKRADSPKPKFTEASNLPPVKEYETAIPLKTLSDDLLANLHTSKDCMRVVTAKDKTFNVKTPPFQQFLIERVLNKMHEKDREAASKGEITPERVFSYELILDGDVVREIVIQNLTADRIRELKSSINWTLEKMHEKMKKNS
ncbi:MAG: hypothetical protein ACLFU9_03615 [Candidatus Bathyarchaeia archaeon]